MELSAQVGKLKQEGDRSRRKTLVLTTKTVWRKSAVQALERKLAGYQLLLQTQLLARLVYDCLVNPSMLIDKADLV